MGSDIPNALVFLFPIIISFCPLSFPLRYLFFRRGGYGFRWVKCEVSYNMQRRWWWFNRCSPPVISIRSLFLPWSQKALHLICHFPRKVDAISYSGATTSLYVTAHKKSSSNASIIKGRNITLKAIIRKGSNHSERKLSWLKNNKKTGPVDCLLDFIFYRVNIGENEIEFMYSSTSTFFLCSCLPSFFFISSFFTCLNWLLFLLLYASLRPVNNSSSRRGVSRSSTKTSPSPYVMVFSVIFLISWSGFSSLAETHTTAQKKEE